MIKAVWFCILCVIVALAGISSSARDKEDAQEHLKYFIANFNISVVCDEKAASIECWGTTQSGATVDFTCFHDGCFKVVWCDDHDHYEHHAIPTNLLK